MTASKYDSDNYSDLQTPLEDIAL